jgi:hypothetical protein
VARKIPVIQAGIAAVRMFQSPAFHHFQRVSNFNSPLVKLGSAAVGAIGCTAAIYDIVGQAIEIKNECHKMKQHPDRKAELYDAILRIINAVGNLFDAVGTVMISLVHNHVISPLILTYASPLIFVGLALSIAQLILHIKEVHRGRQTLQKLENSHKANDLEWLKNELIDWNRRDGEYYLYREFEVINREKYAAQVLAIIDSGDITQKNNLINAMKLRLNHKIKSHYLGLLNNLVNMVGLSILFNTPFFQAANGILLTGAILSFIKNFSDALSTGHMEKKLDKIYNFQKVIDSKGTDWLLKYVPSATPLIS